jgi:UDP-2-acetamido-3-amino-2,3-dideoxy-glucuronate N-acetyltransferase
MVADADEVFVHPFGLCESTTVGPRTRVWAFAHVMAGAVVGSDCNVCDHAFIEGGARVGDGVTVKNGVMLFTGVSVDNDVFIGPGVVFTNDLRPRAAIKKGPDELVATRVAMGATLGAGVVVVCGTTIGEHAFVAAGAVLTRNVAPYAMVAGNPARRIGWCCQCGARLPGDLVCNCGRRYEFLSESDGLVLLPDGEPVPRSDGSTSRTVRGNASTG